MEQSRAEASRCIKADHGRSKERATGQERTEENMTELSRAESSTGRHSKDHSRVEKNRAVHSRPRQHMTEQSRGIVFWGNNSCHKLHCYLKAVSSGETNAKPQKGTNMRTG